MEDKSCWKCSWNRIGGITALGLCWWFVKSTGMAKEIPAHICDKGCKFWTDEKHDFDEIKKFLKPVSEDNK